MIIVYQGGQDFLPLAACYLHLDLHFKSSSLTEARWSAKPLSVIGIDKKGNTVCSLVCGKHSDIYSRAIQGVSEIFNLEVELINVDQLVAANRPKGSVNYLKFMAMRFCFCPQLFNSWFIEDLRSIMQQHGRVKGDEA